MSVTRGTPCHLAFLSTVAAHDIWNEKMSLAVRLYKGGGEEV